MKSNRRSPDRDSDGELKKPNIWARIKIHWWLTGLFFAAALVWLSMPVNYRLVNIERFKLSEPSPRTVISPITFTYEDSEATTRRRQEARSETPPVFRIDKTSQVEDLDLLFQSIRRIRGMDIPEEEKIDRMATDLIIGDYLPKKSREQLVRMSEEDLKAIRDKAAEVLSAVLERGVVSSGFAKKVKAELGESKRWKEAVRRLRVRLGREPTDLEVSREMPVEIYPDGRIVKGKDLLLWTEAVDEVEKKLSDWNSPYRKLVDEIVKNLLRPNLIYDPQLTAQRKEEAAAKVETVYGTVRKGERIVEKGERITKVELEKLRTLAREQRGVSVNLALGVSLFVLGLLGVIAYYIYKFEPGIFDEYRKLLTICLSVLLIMGIARLIVIYGSGKLPMPELLVPTAIASAITAVLVGPNLAMLVSVMVGALLGIMSGKELDVAVEVFVLSFIGGMVAIYALSKLRHRRDLIMAGFYVSLSNIALVFGISMIRSDPLNAMAVNMLSGMAGGLAVAFLTPGLLPFFEYIAQATTDIELLELSDLNRPILIELENNAQGTYYHSINVARLAEAAAERIGANPLLARVGAYYHDIGKLKHPLCFIENQKGENIHDRLGPEMSARIIANHVRDGVEMAKKEKLPKVIQQIIQQHHGTSLIQYFYHKALESGRPVNEEDFRYPGPKPQTKEAAIIMLADAVESAVRASFGKGNPTYPEVRELVNKVISGRVEDGQLDESNLTLKDIKVIADTFVRVIMGMFHERIEYPEMEVRSDEVIPLEKARRRRRAGGG